jgi:hypothetical protein
VQSLSMRDIIVRFSMLDIPTTDSNAKVLLKPLNELLLPVFH